MDIISVDLDKVEEDNIGGEDRYGDDAEETRLGESVKLRQDYPIIVRLHTSLPDWFHLVDGHRRCRAARRVGLKRLKAMLVDGKLKQDEIRLLQLRTDLHKKHLSAHDRSMAAIALETANPGLSQKQLAALIEIDETLLSKYLKAKRLGPEALEAYKTGVLGMTDMVEVAKVSHAFQPGSLSIKRRDGSREDLAAYARHVKDGIDDPADQHDDGSTDESSDSDPSKKVGSIMVIVGDVTVTLRKEGDLSLPEAIRQLPLALKDLERAQKDGHDAKTFAALMRKKKRAAKCPVKP